MPPVKGKEIKRYKNIEIPDELKMLEYQDFKLDVPLNGATTIKIMFDPGVQPEEFPQTREWRTQKPIIQEMQPQEVAPVVEVVAETEPQLHDEKATEAFPALVVEAFTQALEDAQAAGEPVAEITAAMADNEAIKVEIIEGDCEGRLQVITTEPDSIEAPAQPECDVSAKKPAGKGRGKTRAASTEDTGMYTDTVKIRSQRRILSFSRKRCVLGNTSVFGHSKRSTVWCGIIETGNNCISITINGKVHCQYRNKCFISKIVLDKVRNKGVILAEFGKTAGYPSGS